MKAEGLLPSVAVKRRTGRGQGKRVSQMLASRIPLAAERKADQSSVNPCKSVSKKLCELCGLCG